MLEKDQKNDISLHEYYVKLNFQCSQIEFYWNTATPIHLYSIYVCSQAVATKTVWPAKPKIFIMWPFAENVCWPPRCGAQGGPCALLLTACQVCVSTGSEHRSLHWVPWLFILRLAVPTFCCGFPFVWRNQDNPFNPFLFSFLFLFCVVLSKKNHRVEHRQ